MTHTFHFPDMGEVWSPVMISSSRNVHPSSHMRVSPLSNDERPSMCVTCASWETSRKLVWTWPSSVYMVDLDLSKSCLHWLCFWDRVLSAVRTFRPDLVLSALGHGDSGGGLAWPLSGKLCACVWASALRCLGSGAEVGFSGNRALLWVGFPGPPGGQCCGRAPSLSPARFISLGLLETPQVGYLVIIPIFQHIQVE